jgi:Tol biopolymer transport system component
MLTGERLFQHDGVTETIAAVVMKTPELERAPVEVRRLLKKCLEKDPKKRLRDIGDVWELLESVAQTGLPSVAGNAKRRRLAYVATALATLAFAALAAVHFRETAPELYVVRATILPPRDSTFDFADSRALPAVSPDGKQIVFGARNKDGKSGLWIRTLSSLVAQPLTGTAGGAFPFWSPDGRFIGFFAEGKLKKIDTQGGPAVFLADADSGRGGSWSPEGVIVFAPSANNSPLLRVSERGDGATSPATMLDQNREESNHKFPWFLPDGHHFLYETQGGRPETIRVGSIDSNGSSSNGSVIVEGVGSNAVFADGRLLFMRDRILLAQPFDLERLVPAGEAVPLAEPIQTVLTSGKAGIFSASASGLLVYQSGEAASRDQLTWFDRTGKKLRTLGDPSAIGNIEFSPDRKHLGVTLNEGAADDVWIYDVERGIRSPFTSDPAEDRNSIWSPDDGRAIIFASRRSGHVDLYRRASDASSAEEVLYADDHDKFVTSWSPDRRFLLYNAAGPKTGQAIWVLPLPERPADEAKRESAKPFVFGQTAFNDRDGKFSPDGRWVAYVSTESKRAEVYVAPFPGPGGKKQVSLSGGALPRWRSDGKVIFYVGPDQRLMSAEVNGQGKTFDVGQVRPVFEQPVLTRGYLYDVSRDGQQFLLAVTAGQTTSEPLTLVENWVAGLKKK